MAPKRHSGALGKLINEKDLQSKISCQTPFKDLSNNTTSGALIYDALIS
jgi:hypothetical protein